MLRQAASAALRLQRSQTSLESCSTCWAKQVLLEATSGSYFARSLSQNGATSSRAYAKLAELDDEEVPPTIHPRVQKLAEEIMHLNLLEIADLTEILQKRLNIQSPQFGGMMPMGAPMAAAPVAAPEDAAPAVEKAPEKTEFDVKLEGFDPAAKIKVIKEVRVITELGLKEAKDLVEKAPVIIKAGLKKEEAEELKKKLESVGGKIELE